MPDFRRKLIEKIGEPFYASLEKHADVEVGLALKMPLVDEYREKKYYRQRYLIGELLNECREFERLGIKISPVDVVNILFRCKILFAVGSEEELRHRISDVSWVDEIRFSPRWSERTDGIEAVIDRYFDRQEGFLKDHTVITEISHFNDNGTSQVFFDSFFARLGFPFVAYFENESLLEKYRLLNPGRREYHAKDAKKFFSAPSIGFGVYGSSTYAHFHARAWLRTFFQLIRIAGFSRPAQVDFGFNTVPLVAPIASVLLGDNSSGGFCWDEDKHQPWDKSPDGCLFLSFGYRGMSPYWLDSRTFGQIEKTVIENIGVLNIHHNPWTDVALYDVAPTLDILSSATQMPDLGAKILLLYCCLEHLFVPDRVTSDNKKYIVGGIHAIKPSLIPWFDRLYKLRCAYAHEGYVIRDDETRGLIFESTRNVLALLVARMGAS